MSGTEEDRHDEPTLEDALALALEAHRGHVYPAPDPEPYILHPIRVMLGVSLPEARIVALLHDVVEDTDLTLKTLKDHGFGLPILEAVDSLTRRPGEAYEDYIRRLASNPIAREVKLSDLRDNLANNRSLPRTDDNLARIARYEHAQRVLTRRMRNPRTAER